MSDKHTPGPWIWEQDGGMNPSMPYRIIEKDAARRRLVRGSSERTDYLALASNLDNARLIADAPNWKARAEKAEREVERLRSAYNRGTSCLCWEVIVRERACRKRLVSLVRHPLTGACPGCGVFSFCVAGCRAQAALTESAALDAEEKKP